MATNDYRVTRADNWEGPHGTAWHQNDPERHQQSLAQRWSARRSLSAVQPLPEPTGPQIGSPAANAFVAEFAADMEARKSRAVRAAIGGVVAGLAVRAWHNGRRLNPR